MNGTSRPPRVAGHGGHGGHGWVMMICCVPMLMIAIALVVAGAASPGFLFSAVLCTAMMALMMRGMNHTDKPGADPELSARTDDREHHQSPLS